MRMWVVGLALIAGAVLGWVATNQVSAQSALQDYTFVVDSAGDTWLILRTGPNTLVRVGVPILPAADADIAAIPASGQWLIPGDGARVANERPIWSVQRPAQLPVTASVAGIQAAVIAAAPPTTAVAAAPPPHPADPSPTTAPVEPTVTSTVPAAPPLVPSATFTPLPTQAAASNVSAQASSLMLNALTYAQESPVIYKGRGDKDTPKFALKGGDYVIRWEARVTAKTDNVCSFVGRFKNETTGGTFSTFANKRNITTSKEERARVGGVPAGSAYFFEVDTGCEWEIEIEPS